MYELDKLVLKYSRVEDESLIVTYIDVNDIREVGSSLLPNESADSKSLYAINPENGGSRCDDCNFKELASLIIDSWTKHGKVSQIPSWVHDVASGSLNPLFVKLP